ncbi:transposase [Roseovarius sp. A-2]|uniref:transposase n=1 Tax=Roseovarius sp. A-2 TaxID=1570360 RepID=UPI0009B5001A|nr:transposase [Roseovarius sp. A-2]
MARPECRIHVIQLPPDCPHLNPIERLWAIMHQHVTQNRHDPSQEQFANAILMVFRETIPNEWE